MNTNIRNLDLTLLLTLDALYEERNVSRAAQRLSLTQPTVSGILKRLRDLFEDDLYVRTSHGVTPTPRAEALAGPVKDIIASTQSLLAPAVFDPSTRFEVRLCGSDYIHNTLLGPLAGDILSAAPRAKLSLLPLPSTSSDPDDIDILFTTHDLTAPTPPGVPLYRDTLTCISSYQTHTEGQTIPVDHLCTLSHVILNPFRRSFSQAVNNALAARGLSRNIVMQVPNFAAVFQAMTHTELIAFLPVQMASQYAQPFRHISVDLEMPETQVMARWHPRFEKDPRHLWIRERLKQTVASMPITPSGKF